MAVVKEFSWNYTARNADGEISAGVVDGATAVIARVKIRRNGLEPIEVKKKDAFWSTGRKLRKNPQK